MKKHLDDSHFEVLGLNRQSTKEEIKQAYKKQRKLWHPDNFFNDPEKWNEAHLRFIKIVEAYELLENYQPPRLTEFQRTDQNSFRRAPNVKTEMANIQRIRVKSSNVFAIGYDNTNKILQVEFRRGGIYEYYQVPAEVYIAFMNADSKGRFIGNLDKYRYNHFSKK